MAGGEVRTPTVLWAQRKDRLFLTIDLPNVEAPKIHVADEGTLSFAARAGTSEHDKRDYAVELQFLHRVNAKDSKISVGSRNVVVMVMKAEEAPGKVPHVKTDFNKWVDEDEEDEMEREQAFDLSKLEDMSMYQDDFLDEPDSDDDDDLPDLEKV